MIFDKKTGKFIDGKPPETTISDIEQFIITTTGGKKPMTITSDSVEIEETRIADFNSTQLAQLKAMLEKRIK